MTIARTPLMTTITRRHHVFCTALVVGLSLALAPTALAQGQEQQGARLLFEVERGETGCGDLGDRDFSAIGEFVMGRMLGSPQAHGAMDRVMASTMGESGLERMHEVMGARLADCGGPGFPAGAAPMMGMIQMMGGGGTPGSGGVVGGPGGMMGGPGGSGQGYGPGTMMGYDRGVDADAGGDPGAWMAILMLVFIAGAAITVFLIARPRRARSAPLDLLAQRFARGEMTADDYEQRRVLLEGRDR